MVDRLTLVIPERLDPFDLLWELSSQRRGIEFQPTPHHVLGLLIAGGSGPQRTTAQNEAKQTKAVPTKTEAVVRCANRHPDFPPCPRYPAELRAGRGHRHHTARSPSDIRTDGRFTHTLFVFGLLGPAAVMELTAP